MSWVQESKGGIVLRLQIQPKASKTEVTGLYGEPPRLKIRVAAPPVEGEANEELLRFLKKALKVTMAQLEILRGDSSKQKDVFCAGITVADAQRALLG